MIWRRSCDYAGSSHHTALLNKTWPIAPLNGNWADDDGDLPMHQICGECRQAIELILRPAEFDRYVVAVNKPRFLQAIPECRYPVNGFDSSRGVKEANDRHRRLLRAR